MNYYFFQRRPFTVSAQTPKNRRLDLLRTDLFVFFVGDMAQVLADCGFNSLKSMECIETEEA